MTVTTPPERRAASSDAADDASGARSETIEQFRWYLGSTLFGAFGASFFDQVAYPAIAAAVDKTGRFEESFTNRGIRSFAAEQLLLWGTDDDRARHAEHLKYKHRGVKGEGAGEYVGIRYSAMTPQLWNWIALSGMFGYLNSFTPCTGIELRPEEREQAYLLLHERFRVVELPGKSAALPATLAEAEAHYEHVARTELAPNRFLDDVVRGLSTLPLPTLGLPRPVRLALTPAWLVIRPAAGHVIKICSFAVMHPEVRRMTGFDWGRKEQAQFTAFTRVLQLAWKFLPKRITLTPMAYHQYRHEQLAKVYESVQLDSFAPDGARGCPF